MKNNMKKISIIIPIYNASNSIKECIESIKMQKYKNYEIIFVNDGSNDNSEEICLKYQEKDKNVKYIFQKNMGVSEARNNGILNASGDLIYFMDSDDIIAPNLFDTIINNFTEEVDCLWFNYKKIYNYDKQWNDDYDAGKIRSSIINANEFEKEILIENDGFLWNKVYRLKIIKDKKIFFNKEISICEDLLFNMEYSMYINSIKKCEYIGYAYFQSPLSSFNRINNTRWFSIFDAYQILEKNCTKTDIKKFIEYNALYYQCEGYARNKFNTKKISKAISKVKIYDKKSLKILFSKNISLKKRIKLALFILFPNLVFKIKQKKIKN